MYVLWSHTRKAKTIIYFCTYFVSTFVQRHVDVQNRCGVFIQRFYKAKSDFLHFLHPLLFPSSFPFLLPVICFLKTWKSNPAVIIKNCRHPSFHICLFLATQAETKMSLKITGTSTKICILKVKLVVGLYQIGNSMYLHIMSKVKEDMDT